MINMLICPICNRPLDLVGSTKSAPAHYNSCAPERRAKVLIVDDMDTNIKILMAVLKPYYELIPATNANDAIEMATLHHPDIILLDIMMPIIDGYAVCQMLRNNNDTADIPIIFISALNETEDEARGLEVGGVDYIMKPINPTIVKARVGIHLELKRQRDFLQRISMIDGLTGIANRRRFDEVLKNEWRRCSRNNTSLSLIMIDVDYFKPYNDQYGHLAGDECLKRVGIAVASQMHRGSDLVARFGGEEFACLLPDTGAEAAHAMAVRLRDSVSGLNIEHSGSRTADHVTISLGVATLVPDGSDQWPHLIDLADRCLYAAKQEGRNRIVTL